jgi:tRNA-splicing ligase RtcB
MKYYNDENALVIKSWCNNPEDTAIEQAKNLARLPFAFKQICLMPDTHQGYGMPIGGVLATENVVIPNAVGVDIGCGMCSVKTTSVEINIDSLKAILDKMRKSIPVGFNKHKITRDMSLMPEMNEHNWVVDSRGSSSGICNREFYNAQLSLGTLGGGNHFLEIQKGNDGYIWIMVHSGSRNLGKQVADFYNKKAIELNEKWHSRVPRAWDLAFLPLDSEEGQAYLKEMQYCVEFAFANRKWMMDEIQLIFWDTLGINSVIFGPMINIAHNYARMENHFGENVMVHRKGATSAREGEIGLIPGSQGTSSYVVKGKGNPESFMSCSHGAGRAMGRKQAERTLNLEDEQKRMDDRGILHSIRGTGDLDEAPGAYKDISVVMAEQADLVDILVKLEPLAVVKG